ncbi:MAG: hypothetical protein HY706_08935 [Candidatus Hydrogenedentes bacterium]|nr:hypothetical protein [Candidatus Hydrogenedentota bacterium]
MTGKCARCGQPLQVTEANTTPVTVSHGVTPAAESTAESEIPQPTRNPNQCARCGRAFRGTWDRHQIENGVLCHVCANLTGATDVRPFDQSPAPAPNEAEVTELSWHDESRSGLGGIYDRLTDFMHEHARTALLIAGCSVILITLFFVFASPDYISLEEESIAGDQDVAEQDLQDERLMTINRLSLWIVLPTRLLFGIASAVTILYLVLSWSNKLPNETFGKNLLGLSLVAMAVAGLSFVPCVGGVLGLLLVWHLYDLKWVEVVTLIIVGMLVKPLIWALQMLLLGAIGNMIM